jgi:N-acetylglucosaminyldiphosphoundecaprenol N-acetyl-beta-D-mannosaminyltransferase
MSVETSQNNMTAPGLEQPREMFLDSNVTSIRSKGERVQVGAATVDSVTFAEAIQLIGQHIRSDAPAAYAVTPNAQHVVMLQSDPRLKAIYDEARFVFADGMSLLVAARLLGHRLPERVTGVDLFQALCLESAKLGFRIFLLGGQPQAAEKAALVLKGRNAGISIAGTYCPPRGFEKDATETRRIVERVRESRSDLLFVGFGVPKQEYWMHDHYRSLNVRLSIGVGGAFDMVAGITPRAPKWLQNIGLEWLFRLSAEPRRLWRRYLIGNLQFLAIVGRQWLGASAESQL